MAKKKKKKPDDPQQPADDFGLVAPTGAISGEGNAERPKIQRSQTVPAPPKPNSDVDYKQMAWKGFEQEEEDHDPDVAFGKKGSRVDEELDMTPMVDVTFLLLIFFMVTASFTLQKSIQQPPSQTEDPSTNVVEEEETEDDYVEVIIDQNNTYLVTTRDSDESEAPSDREMRARLRDAKSATGTNRLIIRAHIDSMHRKVVTVWDAGINAGMDRIEVRTTDEEF